MAANYPLEPEPGKFVFNNCIEKEDYTSKCLEVTFSISRYGKHCKTLKFEEPVSIDRAIIEVEQYLSQPLEERYFDKIRDDLFRKNETWAEGKKRYVCRGDCLGDSKFLESAELNCTKLTLYCGS